MHQTLAAQLLLPGKLRGGGVKGTSVNLPGIEEEVLVPPIVSVSEPCVRGVLHCCAKAGVPLSPLLISAASWYYVSNCQSIGLREAA